MPLLSLLFWHSLCGCFPSAKWIYANNTCNTEWWWQLSYISFVKSLTKSCAYAVLCLDPQSCLILCDPMDCSPPGFSVHGDSLGKKTVVACHTLLQWIFLTQGSNPGLPHCRWILYCLSHQGSLNKVLLIYN